ncbi:lipid A deacylase LpxR family protein [Chitinophaga vietnamensis]|uniref:lipid A deacylase LpxR family protein n=1 Tax=Chitinophaga vietnamensis TaxID=2593957 RepID=UPI001177A2DE|nr:lipid A deacylase LpxR family protein [Chitinophaga vietnamensis]
MKRSAWLLLLCISSINASGQLQQNASKQLRLYEDDDFFNVWGRGTDRAYSNGTAIGYLYMKKKKNHFIDRWLLAKAGRKAVNVYEWDLMQVMITPDNIADTSYIPSDFYYAGALFATHGVTSYNSAKQYSLHSEIVFGVMGPWAFVEQTQTFVHHIIGDQLPRGWSHQVPNAPLLNYNLTYERMLWHPRKYFEIIGGAGGRAGTMATGLFAQTYLRVGKYNSYFGDADLKTATRHKFQVYLFARPRFDIMMYNALLQGGIFRSRDQHFVDESSNRLTHMRHFTIGMDYGIAFGINRCSVVYTQQPRTAWMSGTGKHSVGNITLLISLSRATIPSPGR